MGRRDYFICIEDSVLGGVPYGDSCCFRRHFVQSEGSLIDALIDLLSPVVSRRLVQEIKRTLKDDLVVITSISIESPRV